MRRSILFLAVVLLSVPAARAGTLPMPPAGPVRVASADVVIVGNVEALEPQDVKVGTTTYRVAVVKVRQSVLGAKDAKTLRIAFTPVEKPPPGVFVSGARPVQLEPGQRGIFVLAKHAAENFHVLGGPVGYFIREDGNPDFDKEVQAAKLAAKVGVNPLESLKGKDADERSLAAAILVDRYRTSLGPNSKQEPIDASESKLILKTLAEADWKTSVNFASLRLDPFTIFQRLGVGPKEGFRPRMDMNLYAAARDWLAANADTFRVQRYVAGDAK